ncbi:hypothetical protein R6Q57_022315 [Mikania cordata]
MLSPIITSNYIQESHLPDVVSGPGVSRGLKRDIRAKKKRLQPQCVASVPDNRSSSSDKVKFRFDCLQCGSKLPKKYLGKKRYLGNENYRGLYWRDPTVNSCLKEKQPGSPRTFSTVLYPRTSGVCAKQDRPCPFPLSIFRLLLCFVPIESKAKLKWFVCLLYLLDERERT